MSISKNQNIVENLNNRITRTSWKSGVNWALLSYVSSMQLRSVYVEGNKERSAWCAERQMAIHLLRSGKKPIEVAEEMGRSMA